MFCSRCGSEVEGQPRFCPTCGLDLQGTAPVAALVAGEVDDGDIVREALAAEYAIVEELGRGGMALVYRARERELDREVAVKVLPFALAFDAEFVERFQREARTAAQLEHPNIIPVYRVGRAGRVIYFSMKYLRGGALAGVLRRRGRLGAAEIRRLLLDCGSALAYAHQRGIVHRDIKPDNIMFDEFGQCLLTDFGIAKAMSGGRLTGTGQSIGTPHYMSPEQARAQAIDGRSDLYSLGVVAYQCLAGAVPFDGEDSFAIGYKHISEPLPVPPFATADDRRLFDVIRRMMMKDPADRYQGCEELIAALQGQPVAPVGAITVGGPAIAVTPALPAEEPATVPLPRTPTTPRSAARTGARPASERPVVRRQERSASALPWLLLVAALGGGGAWYALSQRAPAAEAAPAPAAPAREAPAESTTAPVAPAAAVAEHADSTRPPVDSASAPPARPAAAPAPATAASAAPADSGAIKVIGLPRGSSVLLDGIPVSEPVTRLPVGRHAVAISAPLHEFYEDTVEITAGQQLDYQPTLVRQGAGGPLRRRVLERLERRLEAGQAAVQGAGPAQCDAPGAGYNAGNLCYDVRPQPKTASLVPVPPGLAAPPSPSVLLVKVSAAGRALEVRPLKPSSNAEFEAAARRLAGEVEWSPATKAGRPVEGWTQWAFLPVR